MKNKKLFSLIVTSVSLALLLGLLLGTGLFAKNAKNDLSGNVKRVLIKPNDAESDVKIKSKAEVDIQHEFKGKFSANVPENLIPELQKIADVEDVVVLELANIGIASCGDGVADPSEKCGEPGLNACPQGKECQNCKCVKQRNEQPTERSCFPQNQLPYNVVQVNGGQAGAGQGIDVAILDTGAYKEHIDLDIKVCKDTTRRGIKNNCKDTHGHGTHVAGTVGANGGNDQQGIYGVAPNVNIWSIKVCYSSYCNDDDIAEGIEFAAQNGAEIISMSISGPESTPLIEEAIKKYPDVLFVAAAGNSGPAENSIEYPAAYPEVVAVAAHDSNKIVTSFSSRGLTDGNDLVISERELELSGGGSSVESTYKSGCYAYMSGTSMATPTLAGLAAKVWQGSAQATRDYLVSITEDITQSSGGGAGPGYDIASGYGMPVAL
ncbi:S8 family serine peptidase [Patescibacteria group bacterium]